jgi:hypothetical protein
MGGVITLSVDHGHGMDWSLDAIVVPWRPDRAGIYEFVAARPAGGDPLPDHDVFEGGLGPYEAGLRDWDSRRRPLVDDATSARLASRITRAVGAVLERTTPETLDRSYSMFQTQPVSAYCDGLIDRLSAGKIDMARLLQLGRWLVTQAPDREPVKLGLRLLAMQPSDEDLELARTIGRHDEFTWLAATLALAIVPDPGQELVRIGSFVHGHGRIAVVELLDGTTDPVAKDWLLREGHRHSDLYNFEPAFIAATSGGLAEALAPDVIDSELLESAGKLILDLINFELQPEMDVYEDAAIVAERYLTHVDQAEPSLEQVAVISSIKTHAFGLDHMTWRRNDWPQEHRAAIQRRCDELLSRDVWLPLIEQAEKSPDQEARHLVAVARDATLAGPWRRELFALLSDPLNPDLWSVIMRAGDQNAVAHAVNIAPGQVFHGYVPGDEPSTAAESCFSLILEGLGRFPGMSIHLIQLALQYRRQRSVAVLTLRRWYREGWSDHVENDLQERARTDPELAAAMREAQLET